MDLSRRRQRLARSLFSAYRINFGTCWFSVVSLTIYWHTSTKERSIFNKGKNLIFTTSTGFHFDISEIRLFASNFLSNYLRRRLAHHLNRQSRSLISLLATSLLIPIACSFSLGAAAATKVAFIADQGIGSGSRAVLSLIADENVDIVLIQGDLGYEPGTAMQWDQNITNALGRNFPVLSVVGNHENHEWHLYQRLIRERMNRAGGLSCNGEVGVKANCTFKDLQIVQVAPGISRVAGVKPNDDYDGYIRSSFKNSSAPWRVCSWHKNQHAMQTYTKTDETGWDVYDACLDSGAIIAMGHAHTYSRTYLMKDYRRQEVAHRSNDMTMEPGRSFAVVSGLGGRDIRPQVNNGDWFASVYTQSQGATHGALFCTLEQSTAECYFKAINGAMPDQFSLKLGSGSPSTDADTKPPAQSTPVSTDPTTPAGSGVFRRTDKNEYRWIARDNSGQWSSSWISESCASALGGPQYSGNWNELIALAPRVDTGSNPCDGNVAQSSPPPPIDASGDGYVFSRTDKAEYRWIDVNGNGQIGSVWIDANCASDLGGASASGNWNDLIARAPGFDTLDNPCNAASSSGPVQNPSSDAPDGYVFARTDKREFRWVEADASGSAGNTWINAECAEKLGGATAQGDWHDLNSVAPGFDTIANPC